MSYPTHHTGHITITPPLTWGEIRESPRLVDTALPLTTSRVHDEHGYHDRVLAETVAPRTNGEYSGYQVLSELKALIAAHPGHAFTGHIECIGPDGDMWRYVARGNTVRRVEPRIVWPDEEA